MNPARTAVRAWSFSTLAIMGVALRGAPSFAGDKEGNGAETRAAMLRDLHEGASCRWMSGAAWMSSLAHWPRVKGVLEAGNWLFAQAVQRQISQLKICFSSVPLRPLSRDSQDGMSGNTDSRMKQIAVKLQNEVFVDDALYLAMNDVNRAYLLLHEIMHDFVKAEDPARMTKLRDFVARVHELEKAAPSDLGPAFRTLMRDDSVTGFENAYSDEGRNLTLLQAVLGEDLELVGLCLDHQADPYAINPLFKNSPYQLSVELGFHEVTRLIQARRRPPRTTAP